MASDKATAIKQDWDQYWDGKNKTTNIVYDRIASFYRNQIIIKALNHFIKKTFNRNAIVLHAGCGSGQVDSDIIDYIKITALDISPNALTIYNDLYGSQGNTVLGNIFELPFEDETFDGIYNLGVMEHFTEEEIQQILQEFKRVLKYGGKMVIFWPPVFGLTVRVLDSAHFVLNRILKRNIKLHPDEITRVKSEEHARGMFKQAGFEVLDYYFGRKDVFTQAVIIAQK